MVELFNVACPRFYYYMCSVRLLTRTTSFNRAPDMHAPSPGLMAMGGVGCNSCKPEALMTAIAENTTMGGIVSNNTMSTLSYPTPGLLMDIPSVKTGQQIYIYWYTVYHIYIYTAARPAPKLSASVMWRTGLGLYNLYTLGQPGSIG